MYLEYYQLKAEPFGVTPDPAFLFLSQTHREALASLYYAIETNCGFTALIARPGMGKTTLLFQLMERLRTGDRTAFLFQTQCNSREFLTYLLSDLGHPPKDQDLVSMHLQLNDLLVRQAAQGKRFVIIVDEAQNLDNEVLETIRLLSDFETPQRKLMQIVLSGQPQLAEKLSQPGMQQLMQRISIVSRLTPFSTHETERYIQYRLQAAGYEGKPLFTEEALALIARKSRGIPRLINTLCFNALSLGFAEQLEIVDGDVVQQALTDLDLSSLLPRTSSAARQRQAENIGRHGTLPARDSARNRKEPGKQLDPIFAGWLQSLHQENMASRRAKSEKNEKDPSVILPVESSVKASPIVPEESVKTPHLRTMDAEPQQPRALSAAAGVSSTPGPGINQGQFHSFPAVSISFSKTSATPWIAPASGSEPGESSLGLSPLEKERVAKEFQQEDGWLGVYGKDVPPLPLAVNGLEAEGLQSSEFDAIPFSTSREREAPLFRIPPGPTWRSSLTAGVIVVFLFAMVAVLTQLYYPRSRTSTGKTNKPVELSPTPSGTQPDGVDQRSQPDSLNFALLPAHPPGSTVTESPLMGQNEERSASTGNSSEPVDSALAKDANGLAPSEVEPVSPAGQGLQEEASQKIPSSPNGELLIGKTQSQALAEGGSQDRLESTKYRTIIVSPKQTLRQIALHYLGRYDLKVEKKILALNPGIKDPNLIEIGQSLRIPAERPASEDQ